MRMMECQLCGAEIEYRPARKYCNQCRKIKDDEWYQNHKKESKNDIIKRLEEENKKLRDYADNLDSENDNQAIEIEELKKENKKLNEKYDGLWKIYTRDVNERIEENKKLKDEANKPLKIVSETEAIIDLRKRIEDLEELLSQYDPDWNNSLDDNQK